MSDTGGKLKVAVIVLSIVVKVLGFSRDLVLAHFYGASYISDAYLIATTLPITVFSFVGVAISSTYIPISAEIDGDVKKNKFTTCVLFSIILLSIVFITLVNLFPSYVVKLLAYGFSPETSDITISMLRVSILNVFFSGVIFLSVSYLNSKSEFIVPLIRSIPFDLCLIGSIVLSYYASSIGVLIFGIVFSIIVEFLFITPFVFKSGFRLSKPDKESWKNAGRMMAIALPAIISSTIGEINGLIDRSIASTTGEGSISTLTYSGRILAAFIAIFVTSLITLYYPRLSKSFLGDKPLYNKVIHKATSEILFLAIPLCFGCVLLGKPLINVLYSHGNIDSYSLIGISDSFRMYSLSFVFWGVRDLYNAVFYSQRRTVFPCVVTVLSLAVNIVLNFLLIRPMGIKGLALATSISIAINFVILFIKLLLEKTLEIRRTCKELSKNLLSGIAMSLVIYLELFFLPDTADSLFVLILCFFSGTIVYATINLILKSEITIFAFNKIKEMIKK